MAQEPYTVRIAKQPEKYLAKIPEESEREAIRKLIDDLVGNPRPDGCECLIKKKKNPWKFRKGGRRIVYTIDDEKRVIRVTKVGPRGDVYKGVK